MMRVFLLAVSCLAAAGCADPYADCKLGPARDVVAASVDGMGGLSRWRSISRIRATAVVSIYDDSGTAMVNEQRHVIDPKRNAIRASACTAEGSWTASADGDGGSKFHSNGFSPSSEVKSAITGALQTILHRDRGPVNICLGDEKPLSVERVRIEGKELIRVGVTGGNADIRAYYFDAQSNVLSMVTAGADEPGGDGTVTFYTWHMCAGGKAFPSKISVVKIGKNVLVGDQPVLEVNYSKVDF